MFSTLPITSRLLAGMTEPADLLAFARKMFERGYQQIQRSKRDKAQKPTSGGDTKQDSQGEKSDQSSSSNSSSASQSAGDSSVT